MTGKERFDWWAALLARATDEELRAVEENFTGLPTGSVEQARAYAMMEDIFMVEFGKRTRGALPLPDPVRSPDQGTVEDQPVRVVDLGAMLEGSTDPAQLTPEDLGGSR